MNNSEDLTDITIRPLGMLEVPRLLGFRLAYDYESPFGDKVESRESTLYHWLKMLWHRKRLATFVAWKRGEIVGYISMVFGRSHKFRGNAHLVSAAVATSERNRGIGSKLFGRAESHAKARGARRVEFEVFAANTGAVRLYERLGYEVEGVKRRAVESREGFDDLILMAKFLD